MSGSLRGRPSPAFRRGTSRKADFSLTSQAEGCLSGRKGRSRKPLWRSASPRVQIPYLPPRETCSSPGRLRLGLACFSVDLRRGPCPGSTAHLYGCRSRDGRIVRINRHELDGIVRPGRRCGPMRRVGDGRSVRLRRAGRAREASVLALPVVARADDGPTGGHLPLSGRLIRLVVPIGKQCGLPAISSRFGPSALIDSRDPRIADCRRIRA